jgi:GH25 family lysozyme M1 (1,4-beta-N-acetylmuramidase)
MLYSRQFADISSNNATFDAREYRNTGHVLVAIKATEGVNYTNPDHRPWSLHAGMNWVSVVHYHFARPDLGNHPEDEADHFLAEALPLAGWWDYLCVDVERATPAGWHADPAWTHEFDMQVQRRSRFKSILYANRSTLQQSDAWLPPPNRRVWDADWSSDPDYAPPGYACVFRQHTDGITGPLPHILPGVGECDVNTMSVGMFQKLTTRYRH